jgi:O-antigen/teichoic acid export membrane protein
MSIQKRILLGSALGWFSRGVSIAAGLLLLPILFRNMGRQELGLWLLMGQSWAVLSVLDFGFGTTFTRAIAFAKADYDRNKGPTSTGSHKIADLLATARALYLFLAILGLWLTVGSGFFYLRGIQLQPAELWIAWFAWTIICLSQAVTFWAAPWSCLLQGLGDIGWDLTIGSLTSALLLAAQIILVLLFGGNLLVLASSAAFISVAHRFAVLAFARGKYRELVTSEGHIHLGIIRGMAPLASRAWLTGLGIILVYNTDQLFIARMEGIDQIPAFRAAYLLALNLHMAAAVFASASSAFVSQYWQAGQLKALRDVTKRNAFLGLAIMLAGSGCILALGSTLFDVWLGTGHYVGLVIVSIFLGTFVLEQQAYAVGTACRATGDEAFYLSTLIAGALKITLSFVLGSAFGLTGLAVATLVAQGSTNHWYMVARGLSRLGISAREYVTDVIVPALAVFLFSWVACWLGTTVVNKGVTAQVFAAALLAGIVLINAAWWWGLTGTERASFLRTLRVNAQN